MDSLLVGVDHGGAASCILLGLMKQRVVRMVIEADQVLKYHQRVICSSSFLITMLYMPIRVYVTLNQQTMG